jgi:hypothetical protein
MLHGTAIWVKENSTALQHSTSSDSDIAALSA